MMDRFACRTAALFAHPRAIILFPAACGSWMWLIGLVNELTLLLSIMAISATQLVLRSQDRDTRAMQVKLDALLRGVPEADDDLVGIEQSA